MFVISGRFLPHFVVDISLAAPFFLLEVHPRNFPTHISKFPLSRRKRDSLLQHKPDPGVHHYIGGVTSQVAGYISEFGMQKGSKE